MKKIYFGCSIRGGREDAGTYRELVNHIKARANVLSEAFADGKLTAKGTPGKSKDIWQNDMGWVNKADGLIFEVSSPSLGVGYEIAKAEDLGKPVLALFKDNCGRRLSAMIDGSPNINVVYYKELAIAKSAIDSFIDRLERA